MWNEIIELGNLQTTIINGEPSSAYVYRQVFANKKSVRQSEHYQAAQIGLKPELVFEVHNFEFNNDEKVRYPVTTGVEYTIIRTYTIGEITELTLSAKGGTELLG